MPPTLTTDVWLHALEPITGLWCDDCLLPSVVEVPYIASIGHPLEPPFDPEKVNMRPRQCENCGRQWPARFDARGFPPDVEDET